MSELETKTEVETEDFADDLSDEALDREGRCRFTNCTQVGTSI